MKKLTLLTAIIFATTTFAQIPNYIPTNGLVGWWPFNGNANDESGNGNNGTVNGATLTNDRDGVANKAYSFDGASNSINIGNPTEFTNQPISYSQSVWLKLNDFPTNNIVYPIISKRHQNNGNDWATARIWIDGKCYFFADDAFYTNATPAVSPTLVFSNWYHFIFVKEVDSYKIYLNNSLVDSVFDNHTMEGSTDNIIFGAQLAWSNYYKGILDDIGIWNRALTDCEIKNLYNGGVPNSSQNQTALDTYTWPVNNQTYTQSGIYSDTLVNATGCDSIVTLNLTLSYTGINELNTSKLVVSPNPTKDNFSISGLELLGTITSLEIKDAAGKVVKVLNPTATNFSCVGLKTGVYFLAVSAGKTQEVIKIIIE